MRSTQTVMKSLAIIIPAFNAAPHIKHSIRSALSQVLPPDCSCSIIVVDDGSTDDTADIITTEFGERIVLIRSEENRGRGPTLNLGATSSNAGILCFMDADCSYKDSSCLASHIATLEAADVSIGMLQTKTGGFWRTTSSMSLKRELIRTRTATSFTIQRQILQFAVTYSDRSGGLTAPMPTMDLRIEISISDS